MSSARRLFAVLAAAAVAAAATGCGLGGASGGSDEGGSGKVAGTIVFQTLQLKPTFTDYINTTIGAFEKAHPGTEVKWVDIPFEGAQEKIVADATANRLPDVVNLNPNFAQPLESKGVFLNLDKSAPNLESTYVAGAWKAFQVPGHTGSYGFPWYLTSEVTMYNKGLFGKAGLDPAKPPTTLDELTDYAEKLSKAGDGDFYGMHPALENTFITDLAKLGVPLLDSSGTKWTFNTPQAAGFLDRLHRLYEARVFPPDSLTQDHTKETEAYQGGQIGLFPSGPNFLKIIKENAPKVAGQTGVGPQITGPNGVANMSVMGLMVPKTSKNQATALEFAEFITNAQNQLAFSKIVTVLPSATSALSDPYFSDTSDTSVEAQARRLSARQIAKAQNLVPVQFDDRVKKAVLKKVELAVQGKLGARKALDEAVTDANRITAGS